MPRRAIVMGKGTLAIRVASWFYEAPDYELTEVVPVVPEPTWTSSLTDWANATGVPVVTSGSYEDLRSQESLDMMFSVFYDRIIPQSFIDRCQRLLNLHNGPLPRYRGVSPINWALKNGERSHGVTIHEITAGVDDGPIVSQVTFSLYPESDEVIDAYGRALEFGWVLFQQTMPILDCIVPRPQDETQATYYSKADDAFLGDRRYFTRNETSQASTPESP